MRNTLKEILDSEREYVKDLEKWSVEFRRMVTTSPTFVSENKLSFISKVFSNIDEILNLHKCILHDFEEEEIKDDHRYTEILMSYVDKFECYKTYINEMTISDFYIRMELTKSIDFRNLVHTFLKIHSQVGLSYSHFLFRPIQKLIRYELLFSKVKKKEYSEERKEGVSILLDNLSNINKRMDAILSQSKNNARIFEVYHCLKSKCPNNICLDLINHKRVILKEGVIICSFQSANFSINLKVFVFDHLILLCEFTNMEYFEIYGLVKVFTYVSLKIKQNDMSLELNDNKESVILSFTDAKAYNSWLEIICNTMNQFTSRINQEVFITLTDEFDRNIKNIGQVITYKPGLSSDIPDRFRSPVVEPQLFYYAEEESSFFKRLLFGSDIFGTRIFLNFTHPQESDRDMLIFSNEEGIFKKVNDELICIYEGRADRIYYDHTFSLLMFLSNDQLFINEFTNKINKLKPVLLQKAAVNFFTYNIRNQKYLAVIDSSSDYESKISIYTISLYNQKIRVSFTRKAFIGSKIQYMIALDDMLVVASDTAKVINTYTLQTTDFVNPFDQIIPYHFHCVDDKEPKFIKQITQNITLVCYLTFAFFVNRNGIIS
ncbi:hypothetical protein H311_02851, partial [Anncaliia algerae PRA109]